MNRNNEVETPLHQAIRRGQIAVVERLIAEGADREALYCERNCLHHAIEKGQEEIVRRREVDPRRKPERTETDDESEPAGHARSTRTYR